MVTCICTLWYCYFTTTSTTTSLLWRHRDNWELCVLGKLLEKSNHFLFAYYLFAKVVTLTEYLVTEVIVILLVTLISMIYASSCQLVYQGHHCNWTTNCNAKVLWPRVETRKKIGYMGEVIKHVFKVLRVFLNPTMWVAA